ncbi:hypothetical protein D9M71_830250 [compost metagenome]
MTHAYRPFNQQIAVSVVRCPIPGSRPRSSGHRTGALDASLARTAGWLDQAPVDAGGLRRQQSA